MDAGAAGWVRANLFSNWFNSFLTIAAGIVTLLALWYGAKWVFADAEWRVVTELGGRFILGQYNTASACPGQNCFWRPQVATLLATLLLGMGWGMVGGGITRTIAIMLAGGLALLAFLPYRLDTMGYDVRLLLLANVPATLAGWALARSTFLGTTRWLSILALASFLVSVALIRGLPGIPGLHPVSVNQWGGLMLNLILAIGGITLSLPLGIALALGRRSRLPVVKTLCVAFIETFRGVPLITLLFMSRHLVPLAFPEGFPQNALLNAGIVITLFSSAYMAENIRGGLQALHPGPAEAARALGLPGWQTTVLISLPQAIRSVIPAIVGQFIGLFKDTSLVYIIGMLDILRIGLDFVNGNIEFRDNKGEVIIFVALVFWIFTYAMSRVSGRIERHLGVGER
jgi:general L-amino acid transport system permease protein